MSKFNDYKVADNEHDMKVLLEQGWIVEHIYYVPITSTSDGTDGNGAYVRQGVVMNYPQFIMKSRSTAHVVLFGDKNEK